MTFFIFKNINMMTDRYDKNNILQLYKLSKIAEKIENYTKNYVS